MARVKEFDESRALEMAMRVFCEKGFEGTSLQDLEKAMNLNRTSIYNAFGNKRDIFNKTLIRFMELGRQRWETILGGSPTAKDGIRQLLHKVLDMFYGDKAENCLITLSLMEKSQHDPESQKLIERGMLGFRNLIHQRLERAKREGEFNRKFDAGGAASAIASIFVGFMVLGKANFSKASMRKALEASLALLD